MQIRSGALISLGGLLIASVVLGACSSGPATCSTNTNVNVTGGTLTYSPHTSQLSTLGVTVAPVSPATSASDGAIHLPIASGTTVNNSSYEGTINTSGGIKFTDSNGHSLSVTHLSINTRTGQASAQLNGVTTHFLRVILTSATKSTTSSQVNVSGIASTVSSAGAVVFNSDLGVTTFTTGIQLGTFTAGVTYSCP
jgi:hypothetical protein